jgi:protein-tyrosine phosphatase
MSKIEAPRTKVLFVCLGNICRSPLAEGLFRREVEKLGLQDQFEIDSAGTGDYHVGELADARTRKNASQNGLDLTHRARQFKQKDFDLWDRIIVMDRSNFDNVLRLARTDADKAKIELMRAYDSHPTSEEVPDPWFGGEEGFVEVFDILERSTAGLLNELQKQL